jgi:hypothetical protein
MSIHDSVQPPLGRGATASQKALTKAFDKFYNMFPSFLDVFPDEDAFLSFVTYFVLITLVTVIVLAKYVKINPSGFV